MKLGEYRKLLVSGLGTTAILLQTQFASDHWATVTLSVISTVLIYLVPNDGHQVPIKAVDPRPTTGL